MDFLSRRVSFFLVASFALALAAGAGCVRISSSKSTVNARSAALAEGGPKTVRVGQTTRERVVGVFGAPTHVRELEGGREQLVYAYRVREERRVSIPLVLSKATHSTRFVQHIFEIADGVVVRYWKEEGPGS